MAVQAHFHHHHHRESPLLAIGESSRAAAATELQQAQKDAVATQQRAPPLFLDFSSHGDCGGGRKRPREAAAASMSPQLFALHPQAAKVISLAQLQKRPATTGLRLDFDEASEHNASSSTSSASASASCLLSDELAAQRDQHMGEMDRLIQEHTEGLRRALADTRRRHHRSLLAAAAAAAARRVREKEAEASEAARRGAELEDRAARLRAEAAAWQAKALADQAAAAVLHARLQQAAVQARGAVAEGEEDGGGGAADDAGSCFVDPDRVVEIIPPPPPARPCRACRRRPASVVLLPCRHLCVCAECEPAAPATATAPFAGVAAACCPACRGAVTGTVQVFLS